MAQFTKYQHLERFGTTEVDGIEIGKCHVFPKLDGTNASVWLGDDGTIQCGSRNRLLSVENDNAGFCAWAQQNDELKKVFESFPNVRLYGEWLVPHAIKHYRDDAWRRFYVFDVTGINEDGSESYATWEEYSLFIGESFDIDLVPCIAIVENGSKEQFYNLLKSNTYLMKDGMGPGEGIVIKNYGFKNRYGRTTWAKIVTSEFKEKHLATHGTPEIKGKDYIEQEIAGKYVTEALVAKEFAKIENESGGWQSKLIPRLLNTVFYSVVKEESWNFVKENKFPSLDFKRLQHFVFARVKQVKPELF